MLALITSIVQVQNGTNLPSNLICLWALFQMDLQNIFHAHEKYFKRCMRLKFEITCVSLYTQCEGCLGVIQGFSNFIPFKKKKHLWESQRAK